MNDDRLLRPIARTMQGGRFFGRSTIEIERANTSAALSFPVDASFIEAFTTNGTLPAPAISGQATLTYNENGRGQRLRGTIRNDTALTLNNAVILARGIVIRLEDPLEPGELYVFESNEPLETDGAAPASPIEYGYGIAFDQPNRYYGSGYSRNVASLDQTVIDIISPAVYQAYDLGFMPNTGQVDEETRRRQKFLNAFVKDQYNATARGNNVYLIGWSDESPLTEDVGTSSWRAVDSTVYIVALDTEIAAPESREVTITTNQFTWTAVEREGVQDAAPTNLNLYSDGIVTFRFTPLANARLDTVNRLSIVLDQGGVGSSSRGIEMQLWDWRAQEWALVEITEGTTSIANPSRYIGPLNSVEIRLDRDLSGGYLYIGRLGIEQRGVLN